MSLPIRSPRVCMCVPLSIYLFVLFRLVVALSVCLAIIDARSLSHTAYSLSHTRTLANERIGVIEAARDSLIRTRATSVVGDPTQEVDDELREKTQHLEALREDLEHLSVTLALLTPGYVITSVAFSLLFFLSPTVHTRCVCLFRSLTLYAVIQKIFLVMNTLLLGTSNRQYLCA